MRLPLRAPGSLNGRDKKKKSRERRSTRKAHVETLEVRQLMTIAPIVGAVAVDHASLYQGELLTLTASGVQDSDGSVTGVSIYRDTNGNQTLDANDQSLGQATNQGGGNWTFQVNTSALLGAQTFFAKAIDNDQLVSDPAAASMLVLNHAPALTSSGLSFAQARDLSSASNLGAKVADLTGGITDPDPAAVRGIAIVAVNQAHGVLQYSTNNGSSWTDVGTVSTTSALLLPADVNTRIRLVPSGGYLGSIADAVTFRAWDQSTGAAGTKVDVSVNGGTTAFSTATAQAGFTVTPVIGQPLTISSGSFQQEQHSVASDAAGNFVAITGDPSTGVFNMRRFTAVGVALGSALPLTSAGSGAWGPVIAMAADGHFVTTWQAPSANGLTLWARRFNADLTPAAAAFQVDVDAWSYDFAASVSMGGDGKFVLTWLRYVPGNGIPLWIYGQRYDADGVAQGGTFVQNSPAWMFKPAVAMADDGSFVLSWYGYGWDWAPQGIFLQRYNANGERIGGLAQVTADSAAPQVSMNAAGQFVVTWAAAYNGHTAVWARAYNAQAQPVTNALLVDASPAAANPVGIAVAMDGTGDFLVTWSATEGGHQGVFAHWYSAGGVSRASQFTIATADPSLTLTNAAGGLSQPRLTATATGSLLVAWSTILNNGTSSGVTAQRLQWNEAPVPSATIPTLYLAQGSGVVSFDAAPYFTDADLIYGDALTYSATSSNPSLIAVTGASGSQLSLNVAAQLGLASLTVQVTDRAGRTASAAIPVSVFNPANDAPVLVPRSPVKEQARDLTSVSNLGLRIADMILGVSDLDPGALRGVALIGANTSHGSYQYRLSDDAAWTDIGAVSGTSSLLLPASAAARIRFVPVGGFLGTVSGGLTLRAWDQTTGTAESKVNTSSGGGTSAFSSATDQVTFNVTPAVGDQLQIRSSNYQQSGQAVASDRQGNFVAVWAGSGASDSGLFFQRFSAGGSPISTAQQVANAGVSVASAAIGMAPDGSFVLAWQSTDQNGQLVAKSQRFSAAGVALGSAFQLDSGGSFNYRLSVAVGGDGAFAIAWQTFTSWSAPLGIHVQRFAPDGSKIGNPFKVDADNWSFAPSISMAQDDSFVVAWYAYNWHGPGAGAFYPEGIKARRYDSQGVAIGPQFNVSALGTAESPSVSMNASGGFTVVWSTADPSNHSVASVRSYDNQGQPLSDPIVVDNTSTRQHRSEITVATGDSGEYLVTWTADLGSTIGIRAQAFLANGSPLADPFWLQSRDALSVTGSAGLRAPLVVPTRHGRFLALWSEFNSAGSSTGIVGRQLQLESAPVVAPSIPPLYASKNAVSSTIDVSGYFSDADTVYGDSLSYSLVSGNDSLAQLSLAGSALTLTYTGQTGARQVIVRATDSSNRSIDAVLPVSIYNPANDAPVLAQRPHALFMPRDLTDANNQGLLVADLLAGVSDLDPGALRGIAITAVDTANGTYQYRLSDNSAWTDVGTVSGTSSLLLKADASTRIRFVAAAGFVGSVADAITFRAWDQTSGASGTKVDTSTNGGTAAFSTSTDQLAFSITPLVGSQITVDAGGYLQEGHAVATDKQGNFVTVWSGNGTADGGLFFQRYSASGTALGAHQRVVNAGTSVFNPAIGMSPNGDFVIAWQGLDQAGQPIVLARQYSASGDAKGNAVQIAGAGNYYYSLAVAVGGDGAFVVSWQTFTPWWSSTGIWARRFAGDGSAVGGAFQVNSDFWAWSPALSMADDGRFVIVWNAVNPSPEGWRQDGVMARLYDGNGVLIGSQFNVSGGGNMTSVSASMNSTGSFAIGWSTYDAGNHPVLSARAYGANGQPLSSAIVVDDSPSRLPYTRGTVAIDDLGEYLVTWAAIQADQQGIRAHWYSQTGQSLADQFWVASADPNAAIGQGLLDNPQIAASPGGTFVIVWDKRNSDDGSSTGVFAQRLQLNHAPVAAKLPVTYIAKNSAPATINVATSTYFTDADAQFGDHLLYSIVSSDPAMVTASVTPDGQLMLFAVAGVTGATQVVVRAQDGAGRFANLALRLSIYDSAGDAPTLVHSPLVQVQSRDVSASANLGIKVADLVGGVADLDPGALRGIAIVAANSTRGDYQYRLSDTGAWVNLGSVTTTNALLLSAEGTARIRLVSPAWSIGSTADGLTFRAWDQTGGAAGTKVDTTINGGASAFSTATDQVSFTITPIVGQPLAIGSGSFAQEQHLVASDAAGNFVTITGDRATGAFNLQRFSAAGVPIGSAQSLTAAGSGAFSPVIAMAADGHFVATWQVPGASGLTLWARRFNADLTPVAAAFQVTSDPVSYDLGTAVSMASDGKFVITWLKYWPNGMPLLIYGQRYDANGLAQGGIFVQNSPAWMFSPAVAMADDGSFVLAWRGINWDGLPQGTFLQRYNALGQPVGGTSLVTTDGTAATQVSINAAGQFVVTWTTAYNGHTSVWARTYNVQAQPLTAAILVDAAADAAHPVGAVAAIDALGDFLVTWTATENGMQGLFGHWYSSTGLSLADQFTIATADPALTLHNLRGGLADPHLTATPAGNLIATWATLQRDGSSSGVSAQRLNIHRNPPTLTAPIAAVAVNQDRQNVVIDLGLHFADADTSTGDVLTYSALSGNISLVAASISGNLLTLSFPGSTPGSATITVIATDRNGNSVSTTFSTSLNTAPALVHTALAGFVERDPAQPNPGVLVSSLTAGMSDADSGAVQGVAIVDVNQAHGSLQYSSNNGVAWTTVGPVSASHALLLPANATTRVRFLPTDAYLGTLTNAITFRTWDQTSGTPGSYADTTVSGGIFAFSAATDTVSMTIDPLVGGRIQANSDSAGYHNTIGTALDAQGNSLVAWTIYSGGTSNLIANRYQRGGTPIGSQFQVNPAGTSVNNSAMAMSASGTSIFVWSIYSGGATTVYSQRFNNTTGAAVDAAPVTLFSGADSPGNLSVGIAASGGFVVSYAKSGYANNAWTTTIYARVYDASNVLQGGNPVTVATGGSVWSPTLSVGSDGSFVVEWTSYSGGNYQLQALRYTAGGALRDLGTPLQVLAPSSNWINGATVAQQADGSFVAVWEQYVASGYQVWARRFDSTASGAAAVRVDMQLSGSSAPAIAVDSRGDFGVLWTAANPANGVLGRFFNAASQPASDPFQINPNETGIPGGGLALAANAQGDFAATWASYATNYSSEQIQTQRLQLNESPTIAASIPAVTMQAYGDPTFINLANYLADADLPYRDQLTYSITANDNASLLTTSISGNRLMLVAASTTGLAHLTISASDASGQNVSLPLQVTVAANPPKSSGITDVTVSAGASPVIDLWAAFEDPKDADQDLQFSIVGDTNLSLFATSPSINNATGKLLLPTANVGSSLMTVRATNTRGDHTDTSFTVSAGAIVQGTSAPQIDTLSLANDDGNSATDKITSDPTLSGSIKNLTDLAYRTVEFATGANGSVPLGSTLTDASGSFSFTPVGLAPGGVTVSARVAGSDSTGAPQFGPWTTLNFTLVAGAAQALPQVSKLGLLDNYGQPTSSLSTSSPRIGGQVSGDGNLQNIKVQVDENNDGVSDAVVTTSASGGFVYYPSTNVTYGHITIRARTVDDAGGAGYWSSLTFTYAADPASPAALRQAAIDEQHAAVLAKIGSIADMQNAHTLNSLTDQRNQAASHYHTTNDTANATHDAAATAAQNAYNATVTGADATYQSAVATAHTQFLADVAAAGGDASAYPTDSFTWPGSPSLDATLIGGPARPQSGTFGPASLTAPSFTGAAISWTTVAGYSAAVALAEQVFAQAKIDASSQLAANKTAAESAFNADSSTFSTQEAAARTTALAAKASALGQSNPVDLTAASAVYATEVASAAAARISDFGDYYNPAPGTANAVKAARINASNATYDSEYAAASAVYQAHLNDGAQHTQQQLAAFLLEFNTAIAAATHKGDLEEASAIEQFNNRVAADDRAYGIRADAADYLLATVRAAHDQWARDNAAAAEGDLQRAYAAASKLTAQHLADSQHTKDLALAAADKQFAVNSAVAVATHEHSLATATRNAAQVLHDQAAVTIASTSASWSDVSTAHWNAYQADLATHEANHADTLADAQLALQTADANDRQTEANSNADSQKELSLTKASAVYTNLAAQADAAQAFQVNNSAAQKVYDVAEAGNYRDQLDTVARANETRDKNTALDTRIQKVAEADAHQPFQIAPSDTDVRHTYFGALALAAFNFNKAQLDSQDAFQRAETRAKQDYETSTHAAEVALTEAESALAKTAEVSRATANANYQLTVANAEDDEQKAEAAAAAVRIGKPGGAPGDAAAEKTSATAQALADKTQTIADAVSQQSYDAGLMAAYVGRLSTWNQAQATPWSGYVLAAAQAQQQLLVDSDTAAEQQSVALATADARSAGSNNDANLSFELGQAGQDETAQDSILDADKQRAQQLHDGQITRATDRAAAQTSYENSVVEANQKLKDAESQQAKILQDSLNKAELDYSYTQNQAGYQLNADVAAITQSQYNQLIAAASDKRAGDLHAAELARVDALSAARVAWTADMGAAQVTEATGFGAADKTLADAQHDADVQFAQSQAGAIAAQQRGAASLSKTLDDAAAAADRVWAKDAALAGKDYSQLLAGDDAAFALLQAQNQDAYDLAADSAYRTALVSWSAGLTGQNALLAGYLVHVAGDAVARDNELAPAWEQLTQASSAADVARANSAAAADKTLADGEADSSFTYAAASDTASSTQAGELADADQLQSVAIATAAANRTRVGAYAEAAYNVKVAQAEAAYANTAATDGAVWESIAEAKHRASQWTSADDLLFARANEARDNGDNAAEVIRVQALGLAAIERTQSLGDADVAQVTAIQDAKLASTRSAAAAANHLATSLKDASHDLTNSETAAETTHDHTIAVADKTWTHDGDAASATYASASADADTHYGDSQAADEASYQVASANAAANLIADQSSFSAVYAHAKAAWFLGLSTPSTSGGLSPYVTYTHAMSLADKTDSLAVSAAEATFDDTVSDDAVTYSDSTAAAAALRQKNDVAAENAFSVTETSLQGVREIATVQADRTLAIQVAGAKRDFTIASAKADITQAVADSRAEADRKNALDAAATAYDRAIIETPGLPYGQIYTAAASAAWTQYNSATTLSNGIHKTAIADAGLELVTKQADANAIDTTQLAQANADLQQGEGSANKDLKIALADDVKTEVSTDAASQLLRDQLDAAASKLASTTETTAAGVQSHAISLVATGLWTAEAAQQVTTDAAVAASADTATATYAPLAHYLSDRANAMASWTTDLVSHYIAYSDSQSALDSTESSADSTAQETDSNTWSAQESSRPQQTSAAQDTHDRTVAAADSAFAQAVAPLNVAYQSALATAQRAFIVGQATAQRALDLGGTQATFNAAVLSLKQVLLTAQQSAVADFSSAEFPFEKADRTAQINADEELVLEVNRIDSERQTAETDADKAQSDTDAQQRNSDAVGQAVLDLSYTLWKAGGFESTLSALAANHPSAWASEQKGVADAAQTRTIAIANALSTKQTALANTDDNQNLAATGARATLKKELLVATRNTNDKVATAAHDQALAELAATDAMNQLRSYNAQTQQQKSPFLLSTPEKPFSLTTPKDLAAKVTIAAQPAPDGFFVASDGKMYRSSSGNFIFQPGKISKELQEGEQDLAASTAEVTKTPSIPDSTGPNGGSFVLELDSTVSLDDFVDPTARGFFVAYCKDLNLDPATARVDYNQLHQAWKEVHAFTDRQNKQLEQQAIATVREAAKGWRQDQATAESASRPGFFASVSNFVDEVFATMAAVRESQQSDQHSTEWHIANTPNDYIPGSEAIKWKYLKPAVDDAYRAAHPTLAAWGGEPHQPTAEEKARMSLLVAVAGDTAAGIWVPGYGEYQDVQVLKDPEAPKWQKGLSFLTLAGGIVTGGLLPNFGTFFRPVKKAVNGADELADAAQAAARIENATVHAVEDAGEQLARNATPPHGFVSTAPSLLEGIVADANRVAAPGGAITDAQATILRQNLPVVQRRSAAANQQLRREFVSREADLIAEWQTHTNRTWPKNATPHHIIPLESGGANAWWNLMPTYGSLPNHSLPNISGPHAAGGVLRDTIQRGRRELPPGTTTDLRRPQ